MGKQVCTRCIMDNEGDNPITFEKDGTCNYCNDAIRARDNIYFPNEEGKRELESTFSRIKKEGVGQKYDCMMGLSGGLDSSYALYIAHKHGLRVLAVHVDDGFDTPITKENIRKLCNTFNIDLIVEKPDKELFLDMTRAFIMAGLPDIAIPQDNVLFACLYKYAKKNKIKYFLSGENYTLENITQIGFNASDKVHILDIHKKFGRLKYNKKLPLFSIFEKKFKYGFLYKLKTIKPLYLLDYNAEKALNELNEACGYEYYGNKHWESLFTKFMQIYYQPVKFKIDKRKAHYSSLIVSGQLTREEALERMKKPPFDKNQIEKEKTFILKELGITNDEFDEIMSMPPNKHIDYKSSFINKFADYILLVRKKKLGY